MDPEKGSKLAPVVTSMSSQQDHASAQLEAIFRAFPDVLFILNEQGVILGYRAGDSSLLYMPADQFLGKRMQDVLPHDLSGTFEKAIENAVRTNEIIALKYKLPLPNGERWFDARLVCFSNAPIIVIARDITDHVQTTERVRQQLRQISALHTIDAAITASFDLKVTLSVILREVLNQLAVDAADVLLFNSATCMLEFAGGQGFRTPGFLHSAVRIGQGYAGTAALERRTINTSEFTVQRPGILTSQELKKEDFVSYYAVPLLAKGQIKGVLEIYHRLPLKPGEAWLEFLAALANQAALAIDSAELFQNLQKTNTELSLAYDSAIEVWSQALEISGRENREHTRRVLNLTMQLAQQMGIGDHDLLHMHRGVLLHDIGIYGIPEAILLKSGPLTDSEWIIIHDHPKMAVQMLKSIPYLSPALDIPYHHHERWDGSGYPDGLQGERIPLPARIFAVVDVYDALVSSRPYRPAWTHQEAVKYIRSQSGILFDPKVVSSFLDMIAINTTQKERQIKREKPSGRGVS